MSGNTITFDPTLIWRRFLRLAPRWVRLTLIGSLVVGECVHVSYAAFKPALTSYFQKWWILIQFQVLAGRL
jgi:hypothetical protein